MLLNEIGRWNGNPSHVSLLLPFTIYFEQRKGAEIKTGKHKSLNLNITIWRAQKFKLFVSSTSIVVHWLKLNPRLVSFPPVSRFDAVCINKDKRCMCINQEVYITSVFERATNEARPAAAHPWLKSNGGCVVCSS